MNWFSTITEAEKELKRREDEDFDFISKIRKWKHTKKKKPFFVGTYLEWLNI